MSTPSTSDRDRPAESPASGAILFAKVLRARDVFTLAFGAMIGWSWVLLTGYWVETAGSLGTLIAFLAGGSVIVLIGLTYAELAAALPEADRPVVRVMTAANPAFAASIEATRAQRGGQFHVCDLMPAVEVAP